MASAHGAPSALRLGRQGGLEAAGASVPVGRPLAPLHAPHEAAGEEGHGHEQDDSAADNGGDHGHLEAEGLVRRYGCEGDRATSCTGLARPSATPFRGGGREVGAGGWGCQGTLSPNGGRGGAWAGFRRVCRSSQQHTRKSSERSSVIAPWFHGSHMPAVACFHVLQAGKPFRGPRAFSVHFPGGSKARRMPVSEAKGPLLLNSRVTSAMGRAVFYRLLTGILGRQGPGS